MEPCAEEAAKRTSMLMVWERKRARHGGSRMLMQQEVAGGEDFFTFGMRKRMNISGSAREVG